MPDRKAYNVIEPPSIICCIEWMDASGQSGTNISRNELSGVHRLSTVGWLIREDDEQISVCMDYVPEQDTFREVQHILKINVIKRTEFKYDRRRTGT